jgi:hypothetical protein
VKKGYASPRRHWALTDSRLSANVTLIILRVADLAAALPVERCVSARRGWAGDISSLLNILRARICDYPNSFSTAF